MESIISTKSLASHLSCSKCGQVYSLEKLQRYATCCDRPLVTQYNFSPLEKSILQHREQSMWRYAEMLPLQDPTYKVSLGEGMTPCLPLHRLAALIGLENLWVKDEGLNPTGSFKARGISMAISKAKELGVKECVVPTAGNAGGAMSAYCAAADMSATVIMPRNTPLVFQQECQHYGAKLILVDGLIDQCGKVARQIATETGAFDVSTLKEPYRLEGKKTMGYEIAEQFDWHLPDVILYPTGGGTGLIGIWKAFQEMITLGWIDASRLPAMIAVQSASCTPVVDMWNGTLSNPHTYQMSIANGLSVPKAFGLDLILQVLNESGGLAMAVTDQQIRASAREISTKEGILISPEGAAVWAALKQLVQQGKIKRHAKVLLLNTGSGYKYLENFE